MACSCEQISAAYDRKPLLQVLLEMHVFVGDRDRCEAGSFHDRDDRLRPPEIL
jgi:hypothetical protein